MCQHRDSMRISTEVCYCVSKEESFKGSRTDQSPSRDLVGCPSDENGVKNVLIRLEKIPMGECHLRSSVAISVWRGRGPIVGFLDDPTVIPNGQRESNG